MDFLNVIGLRIPEGNVIKITVGGKVLWQNVTEQLTAPTISLDGDILTMTATDDKTEEFVIFVDGVEMTTVENDTTTVSGTWVFDKDITIDSSGAFTEKVNFVSNGVSYTSMYLYVNETTIKYGDTIVYSYISLIPDGVKGWQNEAYRTITFDGVQTVSRMFYNWLEANARQTITFTISSTSYTALSGMTWSEWVESEYNTGGYIIDEYNRIVLDTGAVTHYVTESPDLLDDYKVKPSSVIVANHIYGRYSEPY